MAQFYNATPIQGADFSGYSKGFKADTSVGDAIKGLGDLFGMGVKATDQYYQNTIKEQAREDTEQLLDDYGNDAAVNAVGGLDSDATPAEIQKGADRLALLKQAQDNGTLKESSFWAQAELISRQLKMRYPGYWEHIDSAMSSQLGSKPALALHRQLEQERQATMTTAERNRQNALNAARSAGLVEVFAAEASGKPLSTLEINAAVANRNGIKWHQESAARNYNLKKSRNEATENDALNAQRIEAQTEISLLLQDTSSTLYQNLQDYDRLSRQLQVQRRQGQGVDPQLQAQVSGAKDQLSQAVSGIINKYALKYGSDISSNKGSGNLQYLQDWVDRYTNLVSEGDDKVARSNTALLQAMKDQDVFRFMTSSDVIRKDAAFVNLVGERVALDFKTRNAGRPIVNAADLAYQNAMENQGLLERKPVKEQVDTLLQQNISNPDVFNNIVTTQANAAVDSELPDEIRSNAIQSLYGERNLDFLEKKVKNEERLPLFNRIANPLKIKEAKKLYDAGKISSDDFQSILHFIRVSGTKLIRDRASEINDMVQFRTSANVTLNIQTGLLHVTPNLKYEPKAGTFVGRAFLGTTERMIEKSNRQAVDEVNSILRTIKEIADLTGEDNLGLYTQLLAEAGINLPVTQTEANAAKVPSPQEGVVKSTEKALDEIYGGFDAISQQLAKLTPEERAKLREEAKNTSMWDFLFDFDRTESKKAEPSQSKIDSNRKAQILTFAEENPDLWNRASQVLMREKKSSDHTLEEIYNKALELSAEESGIILIPEGPDTSPGTIEETPDMLTTGKGPIRGT